MLDGVSNSYIIKDPRRSSFQANSILSEIDIYFGNAKIKQLPEAPFS